MVITANFEEIKTLGFGSISGSYAAVGAAISNPARIVCITNDTEGDVYFSIDGVVDHLFVKSGSFKLFDIQTNKNNKDLYYVLPVGTRFYVKQIDAPVSGAVYVEIVY